MKRILILLIIFTFSYSGYSQDLASVDSKVIKYPKKFSNPEKLALRISSDFKTDLEKVRAVYTWLTNNVTYDFGESGRYNYSYTSKEDHDAKEKKHSTKLSKRVVSKTIAVCEGYSVAFKKICDLLNIKAYVITGASKTKVRDIGGRYNSSHGWNIVEIDNKKYLIDATWGAGSWSNKFERNVTYQYFLTSPEDFIKEHYPDNYKNSLLDYKIKKTNFLNSPLLFNAVDEDFELVSPSIGILNKKAKKKIKFTFEANEEVNHLSYLVGRKHVYINKYAQENGELIFEIDISKLKTRYLTIYINLRAFVGYRLR